MSEETPRKIGIRGFVVGTCYALALAAGCVALSELASTVSAAQSAPQQAAGAAMALGWAVIPYCLARCVDLATRG